TFISFTTGGVVTAYHDASGRLVVPGISVTTNQLSATTGYFSGNVGIGTASPLHPLQLGSTNGGMLFGPPPGGTSNNLTVNAYYSSGWKYVTANPAVNLDVDGTGGLTFNVAASGSANAAITWTSGIRLLNSGFVGIGMGTPTHLLQLNADDGFKP